MFLVPRLLSLRARRRWKPGKSVRMAKAGLRRSASLTRWRMARIREGRWLRISVMPTTETSEYSVTMSTPAARICGPSMPKISRLARCFRAVARRAAYISPLASPAERRREGRVTLGILPRRGAAVLRPYWELCAGGLFWGRPGAVAKTGTSVPCPYGEGGWCFRDARWHAAGTRLVACGNRKRCAGATARGVGIVWEMQLLLFVLELVEAVV